MDPQALIGGFADPPRDSAAAFRGIMRAMARPGRITQLSGATAPAPVSPAAAVVLATLCDPDTGIWLAPAYDQPEIRAWLGFHCGAPIVAPEQADFALGSWADFELARFPKGTSEYPDRSTTLIVECTTLEAEGATLTGPGIADRAALSLPDIAALQANRALFPRGLDFIFTCGARLAALPRSTEIS